MSPGGNSMHGGSTRFYISHKRPLEAFQTTTGKAKTTTGCTNKRIHQQNYAPDSGSTQWGESVQQTNSRVIMTRISLLHRLP